MVQMLFYLRFRSQLRRTQPDLIARLEETVTNAVLAAGGRFQDNRRLLMASFDSDRIGFWLDILILAETVNKTLENAGAGLSGHALVITQNTEDQDAERLCRSLSSGAVVSRTGIWCGPAVRASLAPFCVFQKPFRDYSELAEIKTAGADPGRVFPFREKIARVLEGKKKEGNPLFQGSFFMGLRDGVYHYYRSLAMDIPLLVIRFHSGPICFYDALSPEIRAFLAESSRGPDLGELDSLGIFLFRERLRSEASPVVIEAGRRFLVLLLDLYTGLARRRRLCPVIVLEDPLAGEENSRRIFLNALASFSNKDDFMITGFDSTGREELGEWALVFDRVLKFSSRDFPELSRNISALPRDLREMLYAFVLLLRFFPVSLFPQIFQEEGLNHSIVNKALELLFRLGFLDTVSDPRPLIPNFLSRAEKVLGRGKEKIKALVRNRLAAWEISGRIQPCFDLVSALNGLGGTVDDSLILRALRNDICSNSLAATGEAFTTKQFYHLSKKENVRVLAWIFHTRKALVLQKQKEIRKAFLEPVPALAGVVFPGFKAQIDANISAYRLGSGDIAGAAETVKELMLLNQNLKDGGIPSYRYFSFINLFRQRIDDTLEYGSFAMDLAEKSGCREELVKASYFAASAYFLYGNLSGAERLAVKAEKTALDSGWPEWAFRARFLLGRCYFEGGRYQEALELFASMEEKAPAEAAPLLAAWIFRARVYILIKSGKQIKKAVERPDLDFGDSRLFYLEALFLLGNYEEAAAIGSEFLSSLDAENDFFYTEQPDWSSGFSQCEYLLMPKIRFHRRMISVYQMLAQSCLPLSPDEKGALRNRIQNLIREELLAEGDPGDIFCIYAWYRIQRNAGILQADAVTALSMACKRLLRRAGRVDTPEVHQNFLSLNYWNDALSLAARENKLI